MEVCSVCSVKGMPTGYHFGAFTCYACRAFFRRVPERKRPPLCKYQSNCQVDFSTKKLCSGCRFRKCLRYNLGFEFDEFHYETF